MDNLNIYLNVKIQKESCSVRYSNNVGDPAVGKTSILSAYCTVGKMYPKDYVAVIF